VRGRIKKEHDPRDDSVTSSVTVLGFEILDLDLADFDRQYDLGKIYGAGSKD
jgi:hypothetical protein